MGPLRLLRVEGCRVYCFEPHAENFQLLEANLKTNGFTEYATCKEAELLSAVDLARRGARIPLHLAP